MNKEVETIGLGLILNTFFLRFIRGLDLDDKVMGMLRDFGCNSSGFNIKTCGRLYKIFIQPIMEYGLGLCHRKKDLKIPLKNYKEAFESLKKLNSPLRREEVFLQKKIAEHQRALAELDTINKYYKNGLVVVV